MGSLVPGWNAGAELRQAEDVDSPEVLEEPKGYFAKLEKSRSIKHQQSGQANVDATPGSASLQRAASLSHSGGPPRGSGRRGSSDLEAARRSSPEVPRTLPHADTMPAPHLTRISAPAGLGVHLTDWEKELASLGGQRMELLYKKADKDKDSTAWWNHLESGALNIRPDTPLDRAHSAKATYTPQFGTAGNDMQFCMRHKLKE